MAAGIKTKHCKETKHADTNNIVSRIKQNSVPKKIDKNVTIFSLLHGCFQPSLNLCECFLNAIRFSCSKAQKQSETEKPTLQAF